MPVTGGLIQFFVRTTRFNITTGLGNAISAEWMPENKKRLRYIIEGALVR